MEKQKPLTTRGRLLFGGFFIMLGMIPILVSLNDAPAESLSQGVPVWIGLLSGGIFIIAGLAVIAGKSILAQIFTLLLIAGLAAIGSWIAFGTGARACSADISVFGAGDVSGLACRIPFGIGTVILYGVLIYMIAALLQRFAGGPPSLAGLMQAAEGLMIITLLPILLPLFLVLIARFVFDAVKTRILTGTWPRNESFIKRQKEKGLLRHISNRK